MAPRARKKPSDESHKKSLNPHERAIWRGSISFGLVQIPVGLYRAESEHELHFTMLDKKDLSPVRYDRKSGTTGRPIKWSDIVKGYEVARGEYIVMTDDDFAAANVRATGSIDIIDFVQASEVDPLYYSKPYYLLPQDRGEKTYVLLREALGRADKVGVAKIVIRTRQHLALVRVHGDALVLELLRFPHELRDQGELRFPAAGTRALGVSDRELKMAESLIASMTASFSPESYRDDYHDDLLALIERKRRTGKRAVPEAPRAEAHEGGNVLDIMDLLRQSVSERRGKSGKPNSTAKPAAKRAAPSGKKATPKRAARPSKEAAESSPRARPKAQAATRKATKASKAGKRRAAPKRPGAQRRASRGRTG